MTKRILFYAATGISVVLFAITLRMVFFTTPLDEVLYFNQKIFYYHVPNAFMLFAAVIVCGNVTRVTLLSSTSVKLFSSARPVSGL